jgi:hypothetical protein
MSEALPFTSEVLSYGLSLNDAAYSLASRDLLDRVEAPRPKRKIVHVVDLPASANLAEHIAVAVIDIFHSVKPFVDYCDDLNAALAEMRANLRGQILSGELVAYGYLFPRNPADVFQVIPPDVFEGNIDWLNSAVEGNGLAYVCVRVVPKMAIAQATENTATFRKKLPPPTELKIRRSRTGRPSKGEYIKGAYEKLKQSGEIDFLAPQIIAIGQIRHAVMISYHDDVTDTRGLENETIRKVICKDFRREREALQRASKL